MPWAPGAAGGKSRIHWGSVLAWAALSAVLVVGVSVYTPAIAPALVVLVTGALWGVRVSTLLAALTILNCLLASSVAPIPEADPDANLERLWQGAALLAAGALGPQLGRVVRNVSVPRIMGARASMVQRYSELLGNAPGLAVLLARDGEVLFRSRGMHELMGPEVKANTFETFPVELHQDVRDMLTDTFEHRRQGRRIQRVVTPDGRDLSLSIHYGPVLHEGEVQAMIVFAADITELRRLQALRARFLEGMVDMQEEERRRLARELHDLTSQALTSLLLGLRMLSKDDLAPAARQHLDELRSITANAIDDLSRMARGLHPRILDDMGLVAAVRWYVDDFAARRGATVELETLGFPPGARLPLDVETSLYRIMQEALGNAARHSGASTISIVLEAHAQGVRLIVEDDGCGFVSDPKTGLPANSDGLGLLGIRERVELLSGSFTIESAPNAGTTLFVRIPQLPQVERA